MSADILMPIPETREALTRYLRLLRESGYTHMNLGRDTRQLLRSIHSRPATTSPVPQSKSLSPAPFSSVPPKPVVETKPAPLVQPKPISKPTSDSLPIVTFNDLDLNSGTNAEKLQRLKERALICKNCFHLVSTRTQVVFGVGNPNADLMFVGEAPGAEEDQQGEPFVGPAGQLLTKMIAAMGLSRDQVYIGNILKCRPDMPKGSTGNRKPLPDEMQACLPYLKAQIHIIQPKVMVALGATAVEGLFGESTPIGGLRGKFKDLQGIPIMPTYHPSYLLRNGSNAVKRLVWEDLLKVMERLNMPINDKQRGYFLSK